VRTIHTVGHSTRSAAGLLALLRDAGVTVVADVRRWPASRRLPHFAGEALRAALGSAGIGYHHLGATLGGYRDGGYPAWTETGEFAEGLAALERLAEAGRVAVL
jgi:uncharacterized protein (DUF488 family)